MIKRLLWTGIVGFFACFLFSCVSTPEEDKPNVLVLEQIKPVAKKEGYQAPVGPKKSVPGKIAEIVEKNGVQQFIFIRLGSNTKGLKVGVEGDIFTDATLGQKIGRFKILEIFEDFSRAEVKDLSYKIGKDAMVAFEIAAE